MNEWPYPEGEHHHTGLCSLVLPPSLTPRIAAGATGFVVQSKLSRQVLCTRERFSGYTCTFTGPFPSLPHHCVLIRPDPPTMLRWGKGPSPPLGRALHRHGGGACQTLVHPEIQVSRDTCRCIPSALEPGCLWGNIQCHACLRG